MEKMKRFKNKKTGLVWKVSREKLINRLKRDNDYEEVKRVARPKQEESTKGGE